MARPVRPWFRFYVEAMGDRKLRRLTPAQRWIWVAVLSAARESPQPGVLLVADDLPMTHVELADYAGVPAKDVNAAVALMEKLGMLVIADECICVPKFHARQFESDNVTARTQKHRERSREQVRNVPKNVPGNDVGTDQRQRQRTEVKTPASADAERTSVEDDFAEWWGLYPRKKDKGHALKAYRTARKQASAQQLLDGLADQLDELRARPVDKIPYAATWLNGTRWLDEPDEAETQPSSWRPPAALPKCPADIADDPEAYAEWSDAWWAGEAVPIDGGGTATREAS